MAIRKNRSFFIVVSILLYLCVARNTGLCSAEELQFEESVRLVSLVDEAATLVSEKGEGAFDLFSEEGSKWRHGELYIFVVGLDGTFIVHPDPQLKGKNQMSLTDVNGKPIVQSFITKVTENPQHGRGWSHYLLGEAR